MKANDQDVGRLAKGAGISIIGKLSGRGINFLIQVILARYLGPSVFGLYAISWALLRIIGLIAPLGLEQGIIHYGLNYRQKDTSAFRNTFFISLLLTLLSAVIISLLLFILAPFISQELFNKPELEIFFKIFAFSIPFVAVLRLLSTSTTISKSTKFSALSEEISQPAFELVLILIMILLGLGVVGILWASVISFVFAVILSIFFTIKLFPEIFTRTIKIEKGLVKSLLLFSIPVAFANLFGLIISWVDRILVGFFLTEKDAGIYASVSLVSVLFVTILSGIKMIFSPMIADYFHKGEHQQLEDIYRIGTKWGLYLSLPLGLFFLINGRDFLLFVFGPEYSIGALALGILVLGQLINIGTGPLDIVFIMTHRNKNWFLLSLFAFIFNIFVNSLLIPKFGINGAAVGTSMTIAGMYLVGLLLVRNKIKIWPYDQRFIKGIIASFASSAVLIVISLLHLPAHINVFVSGAASVFTFGLILILLKLDKEDAWIIGKVQQRFVQRV